MEYIPVRVSDIIRQINRDIYLPAIQREFVWGTDRIERLFDSIMADFPIGSFLFWRLDQVNKDEWPVYEFIREFDGESPHNPRATMAGVTKDIKLVLDGQQRITSLFVGLRGSYRYFYYRWHHTKLYLNLLKPPVPNEDNPEELTYGFKFREGTQPDKGNSHFWYPVGRILDFEDAEDAKADMNSKLDALTAEERDNANRLIGRLHNRIHTTLVGNYYQENSQDYDKVLQVFRAVLLRVWIVDDDQVSASPGRRAGLAHGEVLAARVGVPSASGARVGTELQLREADASTDRSAFADPPAAPPSSESPRRRPAPARCAGLMYPSTA